MCVEKFWVDRKLLNKDTLALIQLPSKIKLTIIKDGPKLTKYDMYMQEQTILYKYNYNNIKIRMYFYTYK